MGVEYRRRCLGLGEIEWQPSSSRVACERYDATLSSAKGANSLINKLFQFLYLYSLSFFLLNL